MAASQRFFSARHLPPDVGIFPAKRISSRGSNANGEEERVDPPTWRDCDGKSDGVFGIEVDVGDGLRTENSDKTLPPVR